MNSQTKSRTSSSSSSSSSSYISSTSSQSDVENKSSSSNDSDIGSDTTDESTSDNEEGTDDNNNENIDTDDELNKSAKSTRTNKRKKDYNIIGNLKKKLKTTGDKRDRKTFDDVIYCRDALNAPSENIVVDANMINATKLTAAQILNTKSKKLSSAQKKILTALCNSPNTKVSVKRLQQVRGIIKSANEIELNIMRKLYENHYNTRTEL